MGLCVCVSYLEFVELLGCRIWKVFDRYFLTTPHPQASHPTPPRAAVVWATVCPPVSEAVCRSSVFGLFFCSSDWTWWLLFKVQVLPPASESPMVPLVTLHFTEEGLVLLCASISAVLVCRFLSWHSVGCDVILTLIL